MRKLLFVSLLVALFTAAPAQAAAPGWISTCLFTGQIDFIDPIVEPGVYPTAHIHLFAATGPVTPTETSASLRTKPTTCVMGANHSGYWIRPPEVDGVILAQGPKGMFAYYRCKHNTSVCAIMPDFPEEFGHVVGNAHATSAADNPILDNNELSGYRCGTGGGIFTDAPPATCTTTLVIGVTFGNCRYPDNSTSELTNSNCTMSVRGGGAGVPMPRIQMYWRFKPPADGDLTGLTLAGAPTWTVHADAQFGWLMADFARLMDGCINANRDCGTNPAVP
jgi:hypothetical protein